MLSEREAAERVIVALDMAAPEALGLVDELDGLLRWVKVGMTLYYREGPAIVAAMRERGLRVFLDLKLFDIPFQVRGAAASAAATGADILSIHALGGPEMAAEAARGVREAARGDRARIVAITILTSMDRSTLASVGIEGPMEREVARLARLACDSGADGVVCSPREAAANRALLGPEALIVCPGVRPAGAALGDQARVATPARAIADGASKLVVGRPITHAEHRREALEAILDELRES